MESTGIINLHGGCGHESCSYKCRPCEKVATTGAKLKWHKISVHECLSKGALPCEILVNSKVKLRTHKKKEHGSCCDLCDVVMTETINLKLY